jgi:hypothetical protein
MSTWTHGSEYRQTRRLTNKKLDPVSNRKYVVVLFDRDVRSDWSIYLEPVFFEYVMWCRDQFLTVPAFLWELDERTRYNSGMIRFFRSKNTNNDLLHISIISIPC